MSADGGTPAGEVAGRSTGWVDFRIGYQPAFNGFRGVAIVTFMLYHGQALYEYVSAPAYLPGAFLWLEMFFVQSGFLITSLLIEEWYRTGRIGLRNFYARRILRLFPALLVVCAVVGFWLLFVAHPVLRHEGWREVWSTLLYVNNWVQIVGPRSYPLYLAHGWSLSVEEQFYAIAPLATLAMLGAGWRPRRVLTMVLGLAALSGAWAVVLAIRGVDLLRIYYGTDTRAQGFLIGAALAFAASGGLLFRTAFARRVVRILAWVALPVVLVLIQGFRLEDRDGYEGMFTLAALCFAVLLAALVQEPTSLLSRALSWRPLESTGRIAYGLYLWHYPIMVATSEWLIDARVPEPIVLALWIGGAFAAAGASWRWVERPILRYAERFRRIDPELERTLGPAPAAPS